MTRTKQKVANGTAVNGSAATNGVKKEKSATKLKEAKEVKEVKEVKEKAAKEVKEKATKETTKSSKEKAKSSKEKSKATKTDKTDKTDKTVKGKKGTKEIKDTPKLAYAPTYAVHNMLARALLYYAYAELSAEDPAVFADIFRILSDAGGSKEKEKLPIVISAPIKLFLVDVATALQANHNETPQLILRAAELVRGFSPDEKRDFGPGLTKEILQVIADETMAKRFHLFLCHLGSALATQLCTKTKRNNLNAIVLAGMVQPVDLAQALRSVVIARGLPAPAELYLPVLREEYPRKYTPEEIARLREEYREAKTAAAKKNKNKKSTSGSSSSRASLCSDDASDSEDARSDASEDESEDESEDMSAAEDDEEEPQSDGVDE